MKVAIATVQVPFIRGGAELHAINLKNALENYGHEADVVSIPFKWYPPQRISEHIIACRFFDLSEVNEEKIDLFIGLRFPAYFIPHHNKVLWILHQFRDAYELWGTEYTGLHLHAEGKIVRNNIINADNLYLKEAKKIFANSKNVSSRLKKFNNIESTPLYHPCPGVENFYCNKYDNYILFPSRLTAIKRQHLAVEAMKYTNSNIKLLIVGSPDNQLYYKKLKMLVDKYKLQDRITFYNYVSDKEKYDLYANSRAVLFIPFDEDYGYITLEAFYSQKAVITCTDSGGPLEFVEDRENGFICAPDPMKIAEAIDTVALSSSLAERMGQKAYRKITGMSITWEKVVKELTDV